MNKDLKKILAINLFFIIAILLVGIILISSYKADIFAYLQDGYLKQNQAENLKNESGAKAPVSSEESFVIDAVKKANPAVVSIVISKEVPKYEAYIDPNQGENPFGDLFPGFNFSFPQYQYRQKGTERKEIGGGSGFFVTSDGLIVTNKHVVDQKNVDYTVFTNDGKKHSAKIVARDPVLDIAIIKIDPPLGGSFPELKLGDSDSLEIGQSVIAIGNALGEFRNTVSVGVISGLARSIVAGDNSGKRETLDHVIQTDAAINPGNSGGPLLDLSGKVVGVNVAVAEGSQSIGFALPIGSVKEAIESVKSTGKIVRPYVGIRYVPVTEELKEKNNLEVDYGILVRRGTSASELAVIPGSPADKAGITENDIILEVDGKKLDDKTSFASLVREKKVGQSVILKILHKGAEKTISVVLEAAKD